MSASRRFAAELTLTEAQIVALWRTFPTDVRRWLRGVSAEIAIARGLPATFPPRYLKATLAPRADRRDSD